MTYEEAAGTPLTGRERAHVRRWLDRHGAPGREPAPLLAARVTARYRASRIETVTVAVVTAGLLVWATWNLTTRDWGAARRGELAGPDTTTHLMIYLAAYAVLSAATLGALWYRRRADRRIGDTLRHRVARSSAVDLRQLLGRWFLATALVTYGGGLLVGAGAARLASDGTDRAVGTVFLVAVLVFAAFGVAVLADVSRRPAIAEDQYSLVDDDVLRREDAHRAIAAPYLAIFAVIAIAHSRSGDALMLAYLGYAVVTTLLWGVAMLIATFATAGAAARAEPRS